MTHEQFETVLNARFDKCKAVMLRKSKEYATPSDKLHNFKVAGKFMNLSPDQSLWGFLVKHLVSIQDIVNSDTIPTVATIDEKIGDCINYFILLEAIWLEMQENVT